MRILDSVSRGLLLCSITLAGSLVGACKEGNVDFDGSFDDKDAAVAHGGKDASTSDDDAGAASQDAGASNVDAGGSTTLTAADVPASLASANCEALTACRGAALVTEYLNGEDCVTVFTKRNQDDQLHFLQASIDAKRVAFDPSAVATCTKDIAAFGCDVRTSRLPPSCEKAFAGKVALGDSCVIDVDCADDAFCDKGAMSETCPGVCKALLTAGSGCEGSSQCAEGLLCTGNKCKQLGSSGDSCAIGTAPCGFGFVCRTETAGAFCRTVGSVYSGAVGDSCGPDTAYCADGAVCASMSATAGECEAPVATGAACRRAAPSQCPREQYCSAVNPGDMGTCKDLPAADAACLVGRNQVCAAGLTCISDVCQPIGRPGDACSDSSQCYSGTCLSSLCVTPVSCD